MNGVLLIILAAMMLYTLRLRVGYAKKEQKREEIIRRVLDGNLNARLLSKEHAPYASNDFLINQLIETYQSNVIEMNNNEKKRKELLSNLSHDIRTPLTSIIGYLDAVTQSIVKTDEEKESYIKIANNRSRQLKVILDDIFELAKADANELVLNKKDLNINNLLTDTLIEFVPILEHEKLHLIHQITEKDHFIYADEYCVKRVLENLMNNAIAHGKDGGIIGIDTRIIGSEYCIEIWDKGVGITEDLDKIFLRLYKKNTSGKCDSNGLGLAIAKTLVLRNDGRVEVTSVSNQRTSFSVYFPVKK